jgi:HSP20 family protein
MSFSMWNTVPRRAWTAAPFNNELGRFLDEALGSATPAAVSFSPPADVEETDEQYRLHLDVPGVKKEDIQLEVLENQLHIRGERKLDASHRAIGERAFGKFERVWALPKDADANKIEAAYADGVLTVTLTKAEAAKPRLIKINDVKSA